MRLNKQDGGFRRSISITNNEVSAEEQIALRKEGLRQGDAQWEALGICEYITKQRIQTAVTGITFNGDPVKGDYKFTDEFPMSAGLEENVEFFDLTYEDPDRIRMGMAFEELAPLLWMKAGSRGRRIEEDNGTFDISNTYGVLFDPDAAGAFVTALAQTESVGMAFIVGDDVQFQAVAGQLPDHIVAHRLYDSYLQSCENNTDRY